MENKNRTPNRTEHISVAEPYLKRTKYLKSTELGTGSIDRWKGSEPRTGSLNFSSEETGNIGSDFLKNFLTLRNFFMGVLPLKNSPSPSVKNSLSPSVTVYIYCHKKFHVFLTLYLYYSGFFLKLNKIKK